MRQAEGRGRGVAERTRGGPWGSGVAECGEYEKVAIFGYDQRTLTESVRVLTVGSSSLSKTNSQKRGSWEDAVGLALGSGEHANGS